MEFFKNKIIEEVKLRNLSTRTQEMYCLVARKFITFTKKPFSDITLEDVRSYKLHLVNTGKAPRTINTEVAALKFFSL